MRNLLLTICYLVISVFLTRLIPFSSYFRNLDTMVHEGSHALIALLLSGHVMRIELHADHSGVTYTALSSTWSEIPVSLAGYIGASLFSLLLFYLYRKKQQKLGLIVVTAIAVILLAVYVHQGFGMAWLVGFIAINVLVYRLKPGVLHIYYLLLAFLTLEESALSAISLVQYAFQSSAQAGDASNLQEITGIPALIWALLFALIALLCAGRSLQLFVKARKEPYRA